MNALALVDTATALPIALAADIERAVEYSREAKSAATRRAYKSDWRIFETWCADRGLVTLPAAPESVAAFLAFEAGRGTRPSTISRRVAAIRYAHSLANVASPTDHSAVKSTMQGIRRALGVAVVKKAPATSELVLAMVAGADGSLRALRNRALLLLGFAGGFRRSELVALTVEDISESPEGLRVIVRRSKTDQEGAGLTKAIMRGAVACPVAALQAWLAAAGITSGPLFRRVYGKARVGNDALTDGMVAEIVKASAKHLGLDAAAFAGHSLRAGLVTSAAKRGADLFKIMDVTGHKSLDTLRGYVRDAKLFENHCAAGLL